MSRRAELLIVNLICFGPFAARSIIGLVERKTATTFDDRSVLMLLAIEVVCGAIAVVLLRARGWKFADFNLRPTMPQTVGGMVLLIGTIIVTGGLSELIKPGSATTSTGSISLSVLIALTLINPLYDELFVVAYNLEAAREDGAFFAVTVSAFVRFVCHLDHGPIAAVTILPLGLIFAAVYWRWRVLWPLVVARAVMDFMGYASELT